MNNNNHSNNKSDRNFTNSAWAEIMEQWSQQTRSENTQEDVIVSPTDNTIDSPTTNEISIGSEDFSPERLDDLELDGQLRVLGRISNSQNSFVDTVIARTHSESDPAQQSRPRLAVLKPSFTSEIFEDEGEKYSTSSSGVASDPPSSTLRRNLPPRRPTALLASLAAIALVGCYLASMWWIKSESETAGFPASNEIATKQNTFQAPPDFSIKSSIDSRQDAPKIISEDDAEDNRMATNKAFEQRSKDESLDEDLSMALTEDPAKIDWSQIFDEPLEANSNLVDANQEFDPTVELTEPEMKSFSDENLLENPTVEISSPKGSLWNSQLDWNLALQFHKNGVGSVALNGKPLQAVLLQDNAAFLLREISAQLQRRVVFLQNRLGSKVNGRITVGGTRFDFNDISELDETVEKVEQHIAKLNIRQLSVQELMTIRAGYREGIFANQSSFNSVDLAGKNLRFYTEDEVFTICSIVSDSEALLRNLAKRRLAWEKGEEILPNETKRNISIDPTAFLLFAKSGALHLPDPIYSGKSVASIQNLYPFELLSMLQVVPSVELFRDVAEFQKAKDYVYANGPPEMKLRLSIDKLDRYLEEPSSLSDEMKGFFANSKRRLVGKLRSATAPTNPADGIAMQPLLNVLPKRKDLQGLPLAMGDACKSDTDELHDLKQVSFAVGRTIGEFNGSLGSRDMAQNDAFRNLSIKEMVSLCMKDHAANPTSQKLKTIDQILQIDHPRLRLEMIEYLGNSGTDAAVELIVKKAKFDIEPEVRTAAIKALADIDAKQYRDSLLEGLNYPWHVVAEHSAEALVRLNDQAAIPSLIDMLDLPHPQYPIANDGELIQRELVGINHMRNCLLCHAPSISEGDSVRGLIPHTSKPLPTHYYDSQGAIGEVAFAVRADITYLEQDFSVVRPVENPGPWPNEQRFDYVVQQKKLTPKEAKQIARQISQTPNRNRNAIIFALRKLTGETPVDNSSINWRNIMATRINNVK